MKVEVRFWPYDRKALVRPGTTVLEAAKRARVSIRTRCGGNASCLMCKVTVEDGTGLNAPTDNERHKLGSAMLGQGWRLACQARAQRGCAVRVPEDPLKAAVRAQLAKQREEDEL